MENKEIWIVDPSRYIPPLRLDYTLSEAESKCYDTLIKIDERKHKRVISYFVIGFLYIIGLLLSKLL